MVIPNVSCRTFKYRGYEHHPCKHGRLQSERQRRKIDLHGTARQLPALHRLSSMTCWSLTAIIDFRDACCEAGPPFSDGGLGKNNGDGVARFRLRRDAVWPCGFSSPVFNLPAENVRVQFPFGIYPAFSSAKRGMLKLPTDLTSIWV